jgi:hypothetical protein
MEECVMTMGSRLLWTAALTVAILGMAVPADAG